MQNDHTKQCWACAEEIKLEAQICRFCGNTQNDGSAVPDRKPAGKVKNAPFYKTWYFWLIASLVVLASLNGQNLFQFLTSQLTGTVNIDSSKAESVIEDGVFTQAGLKVTASCPKPLAGRVGEVRQCTVTDEFGTVALVDITIQSTSGDITWRVQN